MSSYQIVLDKTHDDPGNCRVYYERVDIRKTEIYCIQAGEWFFCSKDGEPQEPLTEEEINNIEILLTE